VHASDFPAEGIIATAKDRHCHLIVMASDGRRGLSKVILGSQASRVLALSTVPVLICRLGLPRRQLPLYASMMTLSARVSAARPKVS
jgi:hypothetical protein